MLTHKETSQLGKILADVQSADQLPPQTRVTKEDVAMLAEMDIELEQETIPEPAQAEGAIQELYDVIVGDTPDTASNMRRGNPE